MTLSLLSLLTALAPSAQAGTATCYVDNDGDGYWATATVVNYRSSDWTSATEACGDHGSAEKRFGFDCNDSNANVHPRALEKDNGIDDNCNSKVDEPTFYWPSGVSSTWHPSDTSLKIRVYAKDADVLDRGDTHGDLVIRWSYRPIDDASWSTSYQAAYSMDSGTSSASFTRSNLDAGTVYAFKAQFVVYDGGWVELGDESDQFFGMTSDASSDLGADVRTDIVVGALRNFYRSNASYIGYQGTTSADGTSNSSRTSGYGAALGGTDPGYEQWCSETYVGHTMDFVDSSVPTYEIPTDGHGGIGTISGLAGWFYEAVEEKGNGYAYAGESCSSCSGVPSWALRTSGWAQLFAEYYAQPGDYVHLGEHSTMFLGYDAMLDKVWVVDGNGSFPTTSGNTDASALTDPAADGSDSLTMASNVMSVRAFNLTQVKGVGLLDPSMF